MHRRHASLVTLFASLLLLPVWIPPADAQVYKWTDAEGKVHYGSAPPPADAQAPQTLNIPSQPTPAGGVDNTRQMKRSTQALRELRAAHRGIPVSALDRSRSSPKPTTSRRLSRNTDSWRSPKPTEPIHIGYEDQTRIDTLNSDIRRLSGSSFGTPASRALEIRAAKDEVSQIYQKYGIKRDPVVVRRSTR